MLIIILKIKRVSNSSTKIPPEFFYFGAKYGTFPDTLRQRQVRQMSDTVLVAIIGLVGSGAGAFGGILVSSKLTQYRLEQLEKKVEMHNNAIDRIYKLEGRMDGVEQSIEDNK